MSLGSGGPSSQDTAEGADVVVVREVADWPRSAVRFPIKCSNHELSYALLARARESFELCSHFKSLPPVSDRELSTNLTWRAHRRKPEFPALGSETQSRCVQGERGVNIPWRLIDDSALPWRTRRPERGCDGRGCARLLRQLRSWRGGAAIAGSGALRCRDLAGVTAAVSPRAQ